MVKNHRNDIDWFEIHEEENNPYVEAWWRWWPEVSKTLTILRITGGEPLLQSSTWRLFEELERNPQPQLELNINSNFGVKPILIQRLVDKVNRLLDIGAIKDFKVFTSVEHQLLIFLDDFPFKSLQELSFMFSRSSASSSSRSSNS
jgi:organic radical activating enzyme